MDSHRLSGISKTAGQLNKLWKEAVERGDSKLREEVEEMTFKQIKQTVDRWLDRKTTT